MLEQGFSCLNRPRQHTPHRLRLLPLCNTGDVSVSVQGEACGEVAQRQWVTQGEPEPQKREEGVPDQTSGTPS